jgi:Flp pilus assembly protein TadG
VFPETITSAVSAGQKAAKRAAREKEKEIVPKKGKSKKRVKSTAREVASTEVNAENVSKFAAEDLVEVAEDATTADIEGEGEGTRSDNDNDSNNNEAATSNEDQSRVTVVARPGLTYEVIGNVFDPYVTGIAVRP